ncbi:MAG TPA: hypothetical protein VNL69_00540 [Bacteroidota bacterium]|nr:hypothetical protein [Bacteroidota bacterium]
MAKDINLFPIAQDSGIAYHGASASSTNITAQDSALLVVETRQDLLRLRARLRRLSLGRGDRAYQFRLPEIPSRDNERLTLLLNGYIADCGCSLGSLFLALTAMGSITYYFFAGGTIEAASWREILLLLSVTAAGAIAGKVLGLAYARLKMLRLVHHALSLISVRHVTPNLINHHQRRNRHGKSLP